MIFRILVLIGIVCAPLAAPGVAAANTYENYSDQPTTGGQPVFATKADVMLNTIRNLIEAKDYEGAEKMAQEVTDQAPEMVDGWVLLGYTKSLTGKFEQSNEAYDRAL